MAPYPPPPPGPATPPPGYASSDEKTWALLAHFGGPVGAFVSCGVLGFAAPLISLLAKGNESPTVRRHAIAALNFQAPLSMLGLVLVILFAATGLLPNVVELVTGLGVRLLQLAVVTASVIFGVIAGAKASQGEEYRYPFSISLFR